MDVTINDITVCGVIITHFEYPKIVSCNNNILIIHYLLAIGAVIISLLFYDHTNIISISQASYRVRNQ